MTEHYFSNKPQSESSPKTWKYRLRQKEYTFTSDVGVFSKHEVDFGSKLLIEQFSAPDVDGGILDVGCGYGPIGIVLADQFPERQILMIDVNERAVKLAEKNAAQNTVHNVAFQESNLFSGIKEKQFAAIVTNPPIRAGKKIVHAILDESYHALLEGGALWVVIQKKQGAPSAKEKLKERFGHVDIIARNKGYYLLRSVKYS